MIPDCPDPATFCSPLLGRPVTYESPDFVVVAADATSSGLAFQRAPGHLAPTWPEPGIPQEVHLEVMVDSVADATPVVLGLGATRLDDGGVFADPAGHPFCLIPRLDWAPPLQE